MKVAFTGSSGSGKTTLVKYVAETFKLQHISGSAGDVYTLQQKYLLDEVFKHRGYDGHHGVIAHSAQDYMYAIVNQMFLQQSRAELIKHNDNFVTDRSPVDNLTYFINQAGFHSQVDDTMIYNFQRFCQVAWADLTHVIYVKAVQPFHVGVEKNGSRINNWWYQKSIDAQFAVWLDWFIMKVGPAGPAVLELDYWDLDKRKKEVYEFLKS